MSRSNGMENLPHDSAGANAAAKTGSSHLLSSNHDESWYLKIDEQQFGPATRTQLERFLNPPRLCSFMQVMCDRQPGVWHSIPRHETLQSVLLRFGIQTAPRPHEPSVELRLSRLAVARKRLTGLVEGPVEFVSKYRTPIALVLVGITVSLFLYQATSDPKVREHEILARYEAILQSIHQFDTNSTSIDQWRSFADKSISEIEPIVKELRWTVNAKERVRQNLLCGGRDHLLIVLREAQPPHKDSSNVNFFERRIALVKKELEDDKINLVSQDTIRK